MTEYYKYWSLFKETKNLNNDVLGIIMVKNCLLHKNVIRLPIVFFYKNIKKILIYASNKAKYNT